MTLSEKFSTGREENPRRPSIGGQRAGTTILQIPDPQPLRSRRREPTAVGRKSGFDQARSQVLSKLTMASGVLERVQLHSCLGYQRVSPAICSKLAHVTIKKDAESSL